jgi:hypothetical protein
VSGEHKEYNIDDVDSTYFLIKSQQDTRSLQQNRKIARKRLQLKLDDLINGESSRSNKKATKIVAKKSKNKARNKRRQLKKLKREVEAEDSKHDS